MVIRSGGCACGKVRYQVEGEPTVIGICHCTTCRKATGSVFLAYADWPLDKFQARADADTYQGRSFCPTCGSRVFHVNAERAEINIGSLDDAPSGLMPSEEGWIKRRERWRAPVLGTEQHREDVPRVVSRRQPRKRAPNA